MIPAPLARAGGRPVTPALFDVPGAGMASAAVLSRCSTYRFRLTRRWGPGPVAVFIMCNPSIADATDNDNTIVRCIGFAHRLGCDAVHAYNLHAYRATKPKNLRAAGYPRAPGEDAWLAQAAREGSMPGAYLIAAWGVHPLPARVLEVRVLMASAGATLHCLGTTKAGHPRHPLLLRADTPLIEWQGAPS